MQFRCTILTGQTRGDGLFELRRLLRAAGVDTGGLDTLWLDGAETGLGEALEALSYVPWQAPCRVVVVVGLDLEAAAQSDLPALERLAEGAVPKGDGLPWLLAWAEKADRRLGAVRRLAASGVLNELPKASAEATITAIAGEMGLSVSAEARRQLAALVDDRLALENELAKLRDLTDGGEVTPEAVALAATGDRELSPFALAQAVRERRLEQALALIEPLVHSGEKALRLNALIVSELELIGRVMAARGDRQKLAELGRPPWLINQLEKAASRWRQRQVLDGLASALRADEQLKSTPERRHALILALLVIDLLAEAGPSLFAGLGGPGQAALAAGGGVGVQHALGHGLVDGGDGG